MGAFISRSFQYFWQEQRPPTSPQAVLAFLVQGLLNFVSLKYQGKDVSSFETHPKTMWVSIASLLLYCLVYDVEQRFPSNHATPAYAQFVRGGMVLFGSLSWASLASILFPDSVRPALFLLCTLFSAGEFLKFKLQVLQNWVQMLWIWLRQRMRGNCLLDLHVNERRLLDWNWLQMLWNWLRQRINPIWSVAQAHNDRGVLIPV